MNKRDFKKKNKILSINLSEKEKEKEMIINERPSINSEVQEITKYGTANKYIPILDKMAGFTLFFIFYYSFLIIYRLSIFSYVSKIQNSFYFSYLSFLRIDFNDIHFIILFTLCKKIFFQNKNK